MKSYGVARPVFDGASGVFLDPKLVRAACDEELGEVHKHKVWRRVPRSVPVSHGKRIIGLNWVDERSRKYSNSSVLCFSFPPLSLLFGDQNRITRRE